jgi:hypothetical protein
MKQAKPSSSSTTSLFLIGQNSRGNWVVQDQRGLRGGLFVDRAEALRFAMFENGNRPTPLSWFQVFSNSIWVVSRAQRVPPHKRRAA